MTENLKPVLKKIWTEDGITYAWGLLPAPLVENVRDGFVSGYSINIEKEQET